MTTNISKKIARLGLHASKTSLKIYKSFKSKFSKAQTEQANSTAIHHKNEDMTVNCHFSGKFRGKKVSARLQISQRKSRDWACMQARPALIFTKASKQNIQKHETEQVNATAIHHKSEDMTLTVDCKLSF